MKRTCKQCGKEFELTEGEIQFYKAKGLDLPKRCKDCRTVNKADKDKASGKNVGKNKTRSKVTAKSSDEAAGANAGANSDFATSTSTSPRKRETLVTGKSASEAGWPLSKMLVTAIIAIAIIAVALFGSAAITGITPGNYHAFDNASNSEASSSSNAASANSASNTAASSNASTNASNSSSSGLTFRTQALLSEHYEKHGRDMGYASAAEYQAAAAAVVANPSALHKTEKEDGDDVYYLQDTNDFVIVSTDGYIRTYFRPDSGIEYYNKQ